MFIFFLFAFFAFSAVKTCSQTDFSEIQTFIDSNITRNFTYTNYDNRIQSINLTSKLNYNYSFKKFNYYVKNHYSAAVTKLGTNLYRDLDNVKSGIGYAPDDKLNLLVNYSGLFFSDDKTIHFKKSYSNFLFLSGFYEDNFHAASVWSRLNAGYKFENQIGEFNKGPAANAEFDVQNLNLSDYIIDANVKLGYDYLKPRINNFAVTKFHVDRSYSDNLVQNAIDGHISRIRKDFYFPADAFTQQQFLVSSNIEKRTETILKAFDKFDYVISDRIFFTLNAYPYYKDIIKVNYYIPVISFAPPPVYDTEIQEIYAGGEGVLNFDLNKINLQGKLSYSERDEKYSLINPERISQNFVKEKEKLESSKNNHTARVKLSGSVYYSPTLSNRFELSGSSSVLRYDTPSETNDDDRDELNIVGYILHRYDNLKNLVLITSIDLNLYHTVYIFASKSSNNNWNRVLRLTSKSYFTPFSNFRTVNAVGVLANYTVYDFQDVLSSVRSFSFRQFNLKDSTIMNLTRKFGVKIYGELKFYERGELNWREFSSRPVDYFEDRIINPEIFYNLTDFLILSAGYRYFEQRRFTYVNAERVFDSVIKTYGPSAQLRFDYKRNYVLELISSYDMYNYGMSNLPVSRNLNVYANILCNF